MVIIFRIHIRMAYFQVFLAANTLKGWTTRAMRTRVFQTPIKNSCWTVITDVIIEQLTNEQANRRNDRIVAGEIRQASKCFSTLEFVLRFRYSINYSYCIRFDRVVDTHTHTHTNVITLERKTLALGALWRYCSQIATMTSPHLGNPTAQRTFLIMIAFCYASINDAHYIFSKRFFLAFWKCLLWHEIYISVIITHVLIPNTFHVHVFLLSLNINQKPNNNRKKTSSIRWL